MVPAGSDDHQRAAQRESDRQQQGDPHFSVHYVLRSFFCHRHSKQPGITPHGQDIFSVLIGHAVEELRLAYKAKKTASSAIGETPKAQGFTPVFRRGNEILCLGVDYFMVVYC